MAGVGVALRIARRDARRALGRSALVVALIGLPVVALTAADVLARTAQLSPSERLDRDLGRADARIFNAKEGPIEQEPQGFAYRGRYTPPSHSVAPSKRQLLAALPPGSRLLANRSTTVTVSVPDGVATTGLRGFDYADPAAHGLVRQVAGRAPATVAEVALTRRLASALDVSIGDLVELRGPDRRVTVIGIVEEPYEFRAERVYSVPAGVPSPKDGSGSVRETFLVDAPGDVTWPDVRRVNALGFFVTSRAVIRHPPPRSQVPYYQHFPSDYNAPVGQIVAVGVLVVGMALLEVVLLAGPAFAVGARRRRRDLALIAAAGGERRHVRNIVLSGGIVLGGAAAAVGLALGVAVAAAVQPFFERIYGSVLGHFDVRPLELAGLVVVAVGIGLAAALLPARAAARQDVVAALAGRRGTVRTRRRIPAAGLTISLVGVAVATGGGARGSTTLILVGSLLGQIGLVVCMPALLGLTAGLGRWLPLSPRLALRDAGRNRASAAPAVAAVMTAVAGSVAIGVYVATEAGHDESSYLAQAPIGNSFFVLAEKGQREQAGLVAAALRRELPAREVAVVTGVTPPLVAKGAEIEVSVDTPVARRCPLETLAVLPSPTEQRRLARDPRCREPRFRGSLLGSDMLVDDGSSLQVVTGVQSQRGAAALRAGQVVVFDDYLVENGAVTVTFSRDGRPGRSYRLPAVVQTDGFAPAAAVLPPAVAHRLKLSTAPIAVVADDTRTPTRKEELAAQGAALRLGVEGYLQVERGYRNNFGVALLALVLGSAIITLGAATIATALANEDGRSDLTTLAAVGASPRVRRLLSMSRSGLIAGLGTALGLAAGFVPAVGLVLARRHADLQSPWQLAIPWSSLGVTAVVVPLLAVVVAGLFSRSRLPVERRTGC